MGALSTCAGFDISELEELSGISRAKWSLPYQTHTVRVISPGDNLYAADAVVAQGRGVLIGVHTADCLPLLMADPEAEIIAAVHCGWRGTVGGIAPRAAERMLELGARPERIVAAMGPCICPDCFEVGPEVAQQFNPQALRDARHADLAAEVALQLRQFGITQISQPIGCSKHDERFYSVRRQGRALRRRTLSAIWLKH